MIHIFYDFIGYVDLIWDWCGYSFNKCICSKNNVFTLFWSNWFDSTHWLPARLQLRQVFSLKSKNVTVLYIEPSCVL